MDNEFIELLSIQDYINSCRLAATHNSIESFEKVLNYLYNGPRITGSSTVHFGFGRNFRTFFKSKRVKCDPVNSGKNSITDFNSIQWLMIDESYIAGYFINILFWRAFVEILTW